MILGLHGVMEYPYYMNRFLGNTIENVVLIDFELPIARPDIVTGNANQGIIPYGFHIRVHQNICLPDQHQNFHRCKARYFLGPFLLFPADEFYTQARINPLLSWRPAG